jgi:hypothetical protein
MKKRMVLLAGFGVILLAGCWGDSAAQETSSLLSANAQLVDSSDTLSLQEKAEKSFGYMKAGPADPGKVGCEFLVGGLGAIVGGTLCARVGFNTFTEGSGGCLGCCDVGGMIGGLVGYLIGSNVGSATGVYIVGNSEGEKGSYWAGLGGSLLGTLVGGAFAVAILRGSDDDSGLAPLSILTAAQAGGATIGFNATRKRSVEVPSGAMLNLKDGELALALPQVSVSQDCLNSNLYEVNVFEANF